MPITVTTWNINSVRLRINLVARFVKAVRPDILCLQETKCPDDKFPFKRFKRLGYENVALNGQKGYHGVVLLSRLPFKSSAVQAYCGKSDCRQADAVPRCDRSIAVLEFLQQQFGVAIFAGDFRADDKPIFIGNRPRPRGISPVGVAGRRTRAIRAAALRRSSSGRLPLRARRNSKSSSTAACFWLDVAADFRICCFGASLIGPRGGRAGFLGNHQPGIRRQRLIIHQH